jgi:general secretion pathway protein B
MSYILDALKKADSERKLGSVPDIFAVTPPPSAAHADASVRQAWLPWLLAANAVMLAAAGIAWFSLRQPPAAGVPTANTASSAHVAAIAVATAPTPAGAASTPKINAPEPMPTARNNNLQQMRTASGPAISALSALPASAQTVAEEKPVGTLRDLPENVQREIPAATLNGYIYARNPADRTVLINNKLLHEGEQVEPGLLLEKLTPHGALLNFKGYRYRIPY